jgi:hypothetical protein
MSDKMDNSPDEPTAVAPDGVADAPGAPGDSDLPSAGKYSMPYDEIVAAYSGFIADHKRSVAAAMRSACDEITKRNELYPQGYPQDLANSLANMQHLSNLLDPPAVVGPQVQPIMPGPAPGPAVGPGNV